MRNADEMQADGYARQVAELDFEIEKAQERLAYLRRTKGTVIERLLEVRSRIVETR